MNKELLINNTIFKTKYGSYMYGTNTKNSDVDWKYIFLPPLSDVLLGKDVIKTKFISSKIDDKSTQVDEDFIPIQKFSFDFFKGVTYAVEISFFSIPHENFNVNLNHLMIKKFLEELRSNFLNKKLSGFLGFLNSIKINIDKDLFDISSNKNSYHAIRIAIETLDLIKTGNLVIPFELESANYLKSIKNNEIKIDEIKSRFLELYDEINIEMTSTKLKDFNLKLEQDFEQWLYAWLKYFYQIT